MISQCPRSGVALSVKAYGMRKDSIESKLESINNIISNLEKEKTEMNKEILNAKITGTKLGMNDYGHLTFYIYCQFNGNSCGFGGCTFGKYDDYTGEYANFEFTSEIILRLLNTIGVTDWENVEGKLVRVKLNGKTGCACQIDAIGNILEDKWFNIKEFYAERGYN